ncbi:DUF4215 domain-containing protein [Candidatus Woesearchaeota archaeon]|nr:DUF4215 domain-containing protein [Candidatus Woesearchaeota archaeon]
MATDPEGLFRETPIKVLVQPYPEEKSECGDGIIELEEECDDGNFLNRDGCSAVCTLETCDVVDNGNICTGNEFCDGELISTLDSDTCCVGTCSLVAGTQCTSCGEGIFNVCDSEECSSIQEGCYFYDGFGTNTCSTCKNLKCEDYPNEDSCTSNECRQEVCGWSDDENKCEVSTFCGDGTCNEGKETCGTCAEDCGACAIASDFKTATCEKKESSGCKLNPSCGSGQTIKNLGSCSLTGIGKAFGIGWGTQYECYSQYQTSSCIKDPKCDSGDVLTQYNPCTPECSDGTTLAQCSTTKPKYCNDNINLVDNCGLCGGCLDDEVCNEISGSCELKTAELAASYTSTTKSGNNYYFNMVIKNLNDVGINFDRVDRKFLTTGYSWTSDKNWIIGKCGSVRLNGESECIKEGRYFTTPTSDTYRETWVGTDDNGNSISVSYVISTSEFS